MTRSLFFIFFLSFLYSAAFGQLAIIKGKVLDEKGDPVYNAGISVFYSSGNLFLKILTNTEGEFRVNVPADSALVLSVSASGYKNRKTDILLKAGQIFVQDFRLEPEIIELKPVEIIGKSEGRERYEVSMLKIDPKIPKYLPSAFQDFNKVLATVGMGVTTNTELSSQYAVRGGNFDENLVYVNDIEVYRPFLVRAGQQEGLSFINPDLVSDIEFSAGGWQPRYGDKLSSVLAVKYKEPRTFKGSLSLGLLGGAIHAEDASRNRRVSYVAGVRQKSAQYLLNTLPSKGEYRPVFYDFQSYITLDLTRRKDSLDFEKRTTLGILNSYAKNRYLVRPVKRETTFGTIDQAIRLTVAFEGEEVLEYDSYQTGLRLSHKFSERYKADFILSGLYTVERENFDVEAGYKLCDIDMDPTSGQFNNCIFSRGTGTNFDHARNRLDATIINFLHRSYYILNEKHRFEWGYSQGREKIRDVISEYSFSDSVEYVNITHFLRGEANLESWRSQGYVQHTWQPDSFHVVTYGFRLNHWSLNKQLLFSPRVQYAWLPQWKRDIVFKAGLGVYQQPPFYREMRGWDGQLNKSLRAQTSYHAILGSDLNFQSWGRDFKFITELYGKYITNVVPYDMDNVRLRYYAHNNARAYAAGMDFRVSGEFIKGAESWFSLGVLTSREDVEGDSLGFIRRPTDQRVTAAIFFQDHLPNNPSIKMYLNLVFGSGLPFGPPNSIQHRAAFSAPSYRRVDIGFTKLLTFTDKEVRRSRNLESLWLSLEVLNLIGANNTISYLWITDIYSQQFAVPNTLSARFVNLRLIAKI